MASGVPSRATIVPRPPAISARRGLRVSAFKRGASNSAICNPAGPTAQRGSGTAPADARSLDPSGFDPRRVALAQNRETADRLHREVRACRIGGDHLVDDPLRERRVDAVDRDDRIDADVFQQRVRDVLTRRQRGEVPFFVRFGVPGAAFPEHRGVVVPRAQAAIVPDEVVAHARTAADRALDERFGRMRECLEQIFRQIVGVHQRRFGQFGRHRCAPADAREHFEIPHRRNERTLIIGRERRVAPGREVVGRDVHALPILAQHDADRRPGQRHEPRGDLAVFRHEARGERERVGVAAQHESQRFTRVAVRFPLGRSDRLAVQRLIFLQRTRRPRVGLQRGDERRRRVQTGQARDRCLDRRAPDAEVVGRTAPRSAGVVDHQIHAAFADRIEHVR